MAESRVSDFSLFINHQIEIQERIEAYVGRLEALIAIAVTAEGFYELSENTLCNYFAAAGDLIKAISEANQLSLSELLKIT